MMAKAREIIVVFGMLIVIARASQRRESRGRLVINMTQAPFVFSVIFSIIPSFGHLITATPRHVMNMKVAVVAPKEGLSCLISLIFLGIGSAYVGFIHPSLGSVQQRYPRFLSLNVSDNQE